MASHPPIPILELADHIERLKANDNLKFSQEYEVIYFLTSQIVKNVMFFVSLGLSLICIHHGDAIFL